MFRWIREHLFRRKWLEMSFGELLDKIAILRVKSRRISMDDPRMPDIRNQLFYLCDALDDYIEGQKWSIDKHMRISNLLKALYENANTQWDFEDKMSRIGDDVPVEERLEAMKGSYYYNRKRALLKKEVDELFNSKWKEVKQYSGMTENEGKYKL